MTQRTDFSSSHLEKYYQRCILDVANGRLDSVISSKSMLQVIKVTSVERQGNYIDIFFSLFLDNLKTKKSEWINCCIAGGVATEG